MRLSDFYNLVVRFGKDVDPRPKSRIEGYADTAILYGRPDTVVHKFLVGIDIEVGELLLADRIREDSGLDLVISHHPQGRAYAALSQVMALQVEVLKKIGLDEKVARQLVDERMQEVDRTILSRNHMRTPDAACLLDLPFMCVHTPADNHAFRFIKTLMDKERPQKVEDIIDTLMNIAEYQEAEKNHAGPRIILGNPKRRVGKILIEMTGGTEGPKGAFDKLYKRGVRTIVSMHLSEEHFRKVKDADLNVVIAGHISSDTLGLNLLLDKIEKQTQESLEVINCAGFRRFTPRHRKSRVLTRR